MKWELEKMGEKISEMEETGGKGERGDIGNSGEKGYLFI